MQIRLSGAMSAIIVNPQNEYVAKTATIACAPAASSNETSADTDVLEKVSTVFNTMPLWTLQRIATAKVEQGITTNPLTLQSIVHSAKDILTKRVEHGEELNLDVLKGVVGQVDGHGQCFIYARSQLNGDNINPLVQRNIIWNDLSANPDKSLGLISAHEMIQNEYNFDLKEEMTAEAVKRKLQFVSLYIDGEKQSGIAELFWSAQADKKHYIVVSQVDGQSFCCVTGIVPCYQQALTTNIAIVKAGQIRLDQLQSEMILFSHGAVFNPHVMGSQLTHFSPVFLQSEPIRDEDLLDQCCIMLATDHKYFSQHCLPKNSMEYSEDAVSSYFSAQAQLKVNALPRKLKELEYR